MLQKLGCWLLSDRVSLQDIGEYVDGKYVPCWELYTLVLGEEVVDDGEEGDDEGIKRKWGLDAPSITISNEEDDEIGGTAVQPLIELCPDELPELPLLVKGGRGTVMLPWLGNWLIGVIAMFITGGDVEAEVVADAETLEPAILIMWGVWSVDGATFTPLCGDLLPTFAARRIIRLASSVCKSTA